MFVYETSNIYNFYTETWLDYCWETSFIFHHKGQYFLPIYGLGWNMR